MAQPMAQLVRPLSVRDELRLHSRYIRDTLVPLLSRQHKLSHADTALVHSIFKKLKSTTITLDLLRYSRMEKALMVIVATGATCWPMEVVVSAEEMIQKWEDQLGPLKDLRSDLYGPDGKLEGLKKITTWEERDDDAKSAWSVEGGVDKTRAYRYGHLGFEVGHWWLKPAAAFRDGIIDDSSHALSADHRGVYAMLLTRAQAQDDEEKEHIKFHAAQNDPEVMKLIRTGISDKDQAVRVLRSWKLRSKLAPKAGVRYDGLYRVIGWGSQPDPPSSSHITVNLARIADQPSIQQALTIPMADQLDDWKEYLRLKIIDRGNDFAVLREIVSSPLTGLGEEAGMKDTGYFSGRGSKANTKWAETPDEKGEEDISRRTSIKFIGGRDKYDMKGLEYEQERDEDGDDGYFSRRGSKVKSSLAATPALQEVAEGAERGKKGDDEEDPGYFSRQNSAVSGDIESLPVLERVGPSNSVVQLSPVAEGTPYTIDDETTPTLP